MPPPAKPTKKEEEEFMKILFDNIDNFFSVVPSSPPPPTTLVNYVARPNIKYAGNVSEQTLPSGNKEKHTEMTDISPEPFGRATSAVPPTLDARDIDMDALCDGAEDWDWKEMDIDDGPDMKSSTQLSDRPTLPPLLVRDRCTRCTVLNVTAPELSEKCLLVEVHVDNRPEKREVILEQNWVHLDVAVGTFSELDFECDCINVIGEFEPFCASSSSTSTPSSTISITSRSNMLILHPDLLLSATTIANAPSCSRKPLISLMLASNAPSPFSSNSEAEAVRVGLGEAVVWGNFLHEVMQKSLATGMWDKKSVDEKIEEVVKSPAGLGELVRLRVGIEKARFEVRARAGGLHEFARRFIGPSIKPDAQLTDLSDTSGMASCLALTTLHDVEEDIWSPTYGLKGKIDASVQAHIQQRPKTPFSQSDMSQTCSWTMPFEIKTGRSTSVLEHRAQTMLYNILIAERYGVEVPSGLLYYTQAKELMRVPTMRNEFKDLIMARNELASYLMRKRISDPERGPAPIVERSLLPPTLDDDYKCSGCYAVDGCMLYRKAVEGVEDDCSPIASLYEKKTSHLTPAQCTFFKKWEALVSMEEQDVVRFRKELWTSTAEEREKKGRCFARMVVQDYKHNIAPGVARMQQHLYRFVRAKDSLSPSTQAVEDSVSLLNGSISAGDAITVSVEPYLLAIARGFVVEVEPDHIAIGFDHEVDLAAILKRTGNDHAGLDKIVCRLDKDEFASGMGRIRNNLAQLFYAHGDTKRLSLVVDLAPPKFSDQLLPEDSELPSHLNVNQQNAVRKVLSAKDYAIILGMPGTGKTSTIAEIINVLVKRGKKVLLASYTHSAVDTILLKLKNADYPILRLGTLDKVHPEIHRHTLAHQSHPTTIEQLEHQILDPPVVATTCLSVDHRDARAGGLDVSLFRRLVDAHPEAVVDLVYQYRMNSDIMLLSNKLIYSDRLRCGSTYVAERALVLPNRRALDALHVGTCRIGGCWLEKLLDENCKAVFVNTDEIPAKESRVGDLVQNELEAKLVCQVTEALLRCGIGQNQIGIISLYRQQIKLFSHLLHCHKEIELLTADRSQGRDKDCIIISMVRSNGSAQIGELLKDWRRINVSFTRAKSKLIIFGSQKTLRTVPVLADFFNLMDSKGWILSLGRGADSVHPNKRGIDDDKENRISYTTRKSKKLKLDQGVLKSRPLLQDVVNDVS
ncbi:Dna2-domain-containing protein [Ramaria rubella]|nr:Dna2-domain-containing protein [Ramaria rubella]